MKKSTMTACLAATLLPLAAFATEQQVSLDRKRLAEIETIDVTAAKAKPADYKPDAKVAALLAEIDKADKDEKK